MRQSSYSVNEKARQNGVPKTRLRFIIIVAVCSIDFFEVTYESVRTVNYRKMITSDYQQQERILPSVECQKAEHPAQSQGAVAPFCLGYWKMNEHAGKSYADVYVGFCDNMSRSVGHSLKDDSPIQYKERS